MASCWAGMVSTNAFFTMNRLRSGPGLTSANPGNAVSVLRMSKSATGGKARKAAPLASIRARMACAHKATTSCPWLCAARPTDKSGLRCPEAGVDAMRIFMSSRLPRNTLGSQWIWTSTSLPATWQARAGP